MLIWMLLISAALVASNDEEEFCSTCIMVNQTCYNVTHIFDIEAPYRNRIVIPKIGILRSDNTLFFSFEPSISDAEYYKIGFINLNNPTNATIISGGKQTMNFGTFDIDQDNKLVYLGGSDGIYVLDINKNRVSPYSSKGDKVLNIFYKDFVYFVRDDEFKIVKKKGDNFDIVLEYMLIKNFVINRNNVIVFIGSHGVFASKKDEVVLLSHNPFFRGLTIDLDDVIYAWWIDGIYKVNIAPKFSKSKLTKVAHIPEIGALTFDNDNNFLFTAGKSLYLLLDTYNTTFCNLI